MFGIYQIKPSVILRSCGPPNADLILDISMSSRQSMTSHSANNSICWEIAASTAADLVKGKTDWRPALALCSHHSLGQGAAGTQGKYTM